MLITWIVLAIGQLTAAGLPVVDVAANVSRRTMPSITPGEPSTLVEAIVGVALIAVYFMLVRRVRPRRGVRRTTAPARPGRGRKAA